MKQRTKVIILIALVAIAIALGAYLFKKRQVAGQAKNLASTNAPATKEIQVTQLEAKNQTKQAELNQQPSKSTNEVSVVSGTVTKISEKEVEIKNANSQFALPLTGEVAVTASASGASQPKTVADVRVGDLISISINNSNTSVKVIDITEVK